MFLVGRGATPILCVCRKDRYEKDLILYWAEIAVKGNQKQLLAVKVMWVFVSTHANVPFQTLSSNLGKQAQRE